jgi:N-acetylmuramoyl-L-alanine amidase
MLSRWSSALLVASMALWSALTAAFGWNVLHGGSAPAPPAEAAVVYDVASPASGHSVHYLTEAQVRETLAHAGDAQNAIRTRASHPYAAPKYALNAGVGASVRPADANAPRPSPTPPAVARTKGVVVLDPGHGRGDPGAVHYLPDGSGRYDIVEADSNLVNAELVRDDLVAMGYTVYLTRNGDGKGPGAPLPLQFITSDLYARVALAKVVHADVYVAFHGNGATNHAISGAETWYCGKHQAGDANAALAERLQRAMMDALHEYGYFPPDRGVFEDAAKHHSGDFCQFVVTRESPVPAALLEFLFLTNDDDAKALVDPRAHEILARHIATAIDAFMRHGAGR